MSEFQRNRERLSHLLIHPSIAIMDQVEARCWELHVGFPRGCRSPSIWAIFHGFLRCTSMELNRKWSSQDSNCCPHGIPALHAVASPITL